MGTSSAAVNPGQYVVSSRMKTVYTVGIFIGLIGFAVMMINNQQRAWLAFLVSLFYFLTLALGGLFFTALQHVTKAGWSVNVRRICEAFTSFLPYGAVLTGVMLIGAKHLYIWMDEKAVAQDEILMGKTGYLNITFFLIRLLVFFGGWLLFKKMLVGGSIEQDKTGSEEITNKSVGRSIAFILFFALSYSFFAVDLLMSLNPLWFSTIFGVYAFAGMFQSTMAFMILTILYLKKKNLLGNMVTDDHLHDLGKYMFAFTVFWAYIAFSQYMLIWYANLPEETFFIITRTENSWLYVSLLLLIGKFIVPFLALLPRWAKRNHAHLAAVACLVLVMQYVDIYWLSYPVFYGDEVQFSIGEVAIFLGFLGTFLFAVTRFLSTHSLIPLKDPRIEESLHHHVVY